MAPCLTLHFIFFDKKCTRWVDIINITFLLLLLVLPKPKIITTIFDKVSSFRLKVVIGGVIESEIYNINMVEVGMVV